MRNLMTNMRFILLWSLGSIVAIFTAIIVGFILFMLGGFTAIALWGEEIATQSAVLAFIFLLTLFSTIGIAVGLIFGGIQKAILRMRTREPWRGWLISSALGGMMGIDALAMILITQASGYIMWMTVPPVDTLMWFGFQAIVILFGCIGFSQMFPLAHYVRGAWVWILANIVAAIVLFTLLTVGLMSWAVTPLLTILAIGFVIASPGIVTGFAMVWLIEGNWRQDY